MMRNDAESIPPSINPSLSPPARAFYFLWDSGTLGLWVFGFPRIAGILFPGWKCLLAAANALGIGAASFASHAGTGTEIGNGKRETGNGDGKRELGSGVEMERAKI